MLHSVAARVSEAARIVTLRHPNSMACVVFRKHVLRADSPPGSMGGSPTLGGLGVLTSEDESNYEWTLVGYGKILFTGGFAGAAHVDRNDALNIQNTAQGLIELLEQPDGIGAINGNIVNRDAPQKNDVIYAFPKLVTERNDVVYVIPADEVNLPYEVVQVEGSVNVHPYTRSYLLNARDDLDYLEQEVGVFP